MKVVIDRQKWLRGRGASQLLDPRSGKMCCLGFAALAAGAVNSDIFGQYTPKSISDPSRFPKLALLLEESIGDKSITKNSDVCSYLMNANDHAEMTETQREKVICEHGAQAGLEFEFAN